MMNSVIGVTIPEERKIYEIILSFSPDRGQYVKTKPIHESQEILKDNKNELRVSLKLMINKELISLLLGFGNDLLVLKPIILRKTIQQLLEKALEK